jgi:hypothetical protein
MSEKYITHELIIETDIDDTEIILLQISLTLNDIINFQQINEGSKYKTKIILSDNKKKKQFRYSYHFVIFYNKKTKQIIRKNINARLNQLYLKTLSNKNFKNEILNLRASFKLNNKDESKNYNTFIQKINKEPELFADLYKKYKISNFFDKTIFYTFLVEPETDKKDILKLLLGHLVMTHSHKACYNLIPFLRYNNFLGEYDIHCLLFDDTKENDIKNSMKAIKYLQNIVVQNVNIKKSFDIIKFIEIETLNKLQYIKDLPDSEKAQLAYEDEGEEDEEENASYGKKIRRNTNKFKKQKARSKKYFK